MRVPSITAGGKQWLVRNEDISDVLKSKAVVEMENLRVGIGSLLEAEWQEGLYFNVPHLLKSRKWA